MNISYDLWPIWCDYLEEQGQDTELLRYVMTYNVFNSIGISIGGWTCVSDVAMHGLNGFWPQLFGIKGFLADQRGFRDVAQSNLFIGYDMLYQQDLKGVGHNEN